MTNQIEKIMDDMETIKENGYDLSGRECTFTKGDSIRAWDFEPFEGRPNYYVEGTFNGYSDDGRLIITDITNDTMMEPGARTEIFTPPFKSLIFGEWNGRITKL